MFALLFSQRLGVPKSNYFYLARSRKRKHKRGGMVAFKVSSPPLLRDRNTPLLPPMLLLELLFEVEVHVLLLLRVVLLLLLVHMRGMGVGFEAACVGLLSLLGHMRGVGVGLETAWVVVVAWVHARRGRGPRGGFGCCRCLGTCAAWAWASRRWAARWAAS